MTKIAFSPGPGYWRQSVTFDLDPPTGAASPEGHRREHTARKSFVQDCYILYTFPSSDGVEGISAEGL